MRLPERLLYSSQQCLLALLEKWKRADDRDQMSDALLTDFSKAFDCLDHELLIAKPKAYGLSIPALKLVCDFGVLQGSIIRPLLLNIFLTNCLFILNDFDIASYADDNNTYFITDDFNGVMLLFRKRIKSFV